MHFYLHIPVETYMDSSVQLCLNPHLSSSSYQFAVRKKKSFEKLPNLPANLT